MKAFLLLAFTVILSSCGNLKYLKEDEKLYTGSSVEIQEVEAIPEKKSLGSELTALTLPKPNTKFLGVFRLKLWFYNIAGEPKKDKGFKHWVKAKLGEPPVLSKNVNPGNTAELLKNRLYNKGFFNASVNWELVEKGKKMRVVYTALVAAPYRINEFKFPDSSNAINSINNIIARSRNRTVLKVGDPYSLDVLMEERQRIDQALKNEGYYYFSPDYLLFKADSTIGNKTVNLYLTVKSDIPLDAAKQYYINNIIILSNYSLNQDAVSVASDTIKLDRIYFVASDSTFKPKTIISNVYLKPGQKYSRRRHDLTLNRLMGLGVFKFVNLRFEKIDSSGSSKLNCYVYLTPMKRLSLRSEVQLVSKSNNFTGPGFKSSFRNRNLFRGAELFLFNFNTGFETQISSKQSGLFSYEYGVETELYIPRFVVPFFDINTQAMYVPKTRLQLGYQNLNRVQYFNMNSVTFSYGYVWKSSRMKEHKLNPLNVNYVRLGHTTPLFDSILASNFFLRRSFEQQFILGPTYNYTYNNQVNPRLKNHFYFSGGIDVSGALTSLSNFAIRGPQSSSEPYKLMGLPFAQYVKFDIDFRHYYNINKKKKIASRFLTGIGIPYGSSLSLPYVKQYFIGGTNSVRAFRARSIGPGDYTSPDSVSGTFFVDQAGDLKLEMNTEYRFDLTGIFKGAVFLDAGNIWLLNANPEKPNSEFQINNFYNQIAVGTGFGLRVDVSFFVLRFDIAFPLRMPVRNADGQTEWQWLSGSSGSGSPFSRDNVTLNIAIGYPF